MDSTISTCAQPADPLDRHIRRAGINFNRWYMVAKASEIREQPVGRELWRRPLMVFRTRDGELHAFSSTVRCSIASSTSFGWRSVMRRFCSSIPF